MFAKTVVSGLIIISILGSQLALASAPLPVATESNLEKEEDALNKIKINKEKQQLDELFKVVLNNSPVSEDEFSKIYDNALFKSFVPENSKVNQVLFMEDGIKSIMIDYEEGNIRTIVTYYDDGTVRKTVSDTTTGIAEENFNNVKGDYYDKKEDINKERTEEELKKIDKLLEEEKFAEIEALPDTTIDFVNDIPTVSFENGAIESGNTPLSRSTRAVAATPVLVYPAPSHETFQRRYTAKQVYGTSFVSQKLKDLGYSGNSHVRVFETVNAFNQVKMKSQVFNADTSISLIMAAWDVARATALGWLGWFGVVKTLNDTINKAAEIVRENEYEFQGGKEATVEDPTKHSNKQVEVVQYWDKGLMTLIWDYDSVKGYNNARWGHSARSSALDMSNVTVGSNAVNIYNSNLASRGYWSHGLGQLGY
ncbi:hypothetical protein M3223_08105 [Paenibacillus pasadenensis]|uniref:hypothetical protein n=1 Tax=Paenibacillus pasadenensis TaxID=217090 RepID=UPI002040C71B|nr:hypothetical protein [Paenibacillus pasadenensis]MCM3747316.1 hypothetical protein [Paenibacillus pasadenensis]